MWRQTRACMYRIKMVDNVSIKRRRVVTQRSFSVDKVHLCKSEHVRVVWISLSVGYSGKLSDDILFNAGITPIATGIRKYVGDLRRIIDQLRISKTRQHKCCLQTLVKSKARLCTFKY